MSLNTDPIADMLARIRNALMRKKEFVDIPFSKFKLTIIKILKREGYILDYAIIDLKPAPIIKVFLKYKDGEPVIHELKRVSKPGRRIYVNSKNIPTVINGLGIAIISTSKGVLTDKEARKENVGGELVCTIW